MPKDTMIAFKVESRFKAKLAAAAASEQRSLSNFIEKVLKEEIERRERKASAKNSTKQS